MLYIGRREREGFTITVGTTRVRVVIDRVQGKSCRVGIDAPDEVTIWRNELQHKIDEQKRAEHKRMERAPCPPTD